MNLVSTNVCPNNLSLFLWNDMDSPYLYQSKTRTYAILVLHYYYNQEVSPAETGHFIYLLFVTNNIKGTRPIYLFIYLFIVLFIYLLFVTRQIYRNDSRLSYNLQKNNLCHDINYRL